MSDEQTQEIEDESTEQPVVSEEAEPEAANTEETEQTEELEEPEHDVSDEAPQESRSQQRIAELVAQREEARRQTAILEQRLASQNDADAPKEDDFENYDAYNRANIRYEAQQALKQERLADIEAQRESDARLVQQQFQLRAESGRAKHADFDTVIGNPDLTINESMLQVIAESESGADLAYHLGKNPVEAARLASMPPAMMGMEMARIESRLSVQPEPSIPTPIDTGSNVSGTGESSVPDLGKMSTEEYIKQRRAQ